MLQPGLHLLKRDFSRSEEKPLVTIISAFYNAAEHFEQTYRCVMNQTFPWFEWIIVNDGSTDIQQVALLKKYVAEDTRILLLEQPNGGLAKARNTAIAHAQTEILIPLDCDDLISPTFIEMLWWTLCQSPDATWAYTDTIGFGTQSYKWKKCFNARQMKTNNLLVATAAIRKSAMIECNAYDCISKHFFEDWALWLKLMGRGYYPVHVNENAFWYRRSDTGELAHAGRNEEQRSYLNQLAQKVDDNLTAIEYPRVGQKRFMPPRRSNFQRKLYADHSKTRLLLILPWLEVGGADIFNLELVARLDPLHYDITIVTTLPSENKIRDRFENVTSEVYILPNFMDADQYPEFVSYLINSREIDIILISNSSHGYGMAPWLRTQYPEVVIFDYVHMEEWYWRNGGYARQSARLGDVLEKTCVCNNSTARVLTEVFHRTRNEIETVYIGVDEQKFNAIDVDNSEIYSKWHISPERPIVLFPCRLNMQKRPYLMLDIAKVVQAQVPNVLFLVVGDGAERAEMESTIQQRKLEKIVQLIGYEEDLRPYYKAANVTLICSLKEGLALTAYESCAMGTPVVSSDVGGQGEMIDDKVGALIPLMQNEKLNWDTRISNQEEVQSYAKALIHILLNLELQKQMGIECRKRIESRFTITHMVARMDSMMQTLCYSNEEKERRRLKSQELRDNEQLMEEFYTMLTEFEDVDTMRWLYNKLDIGDRKKFISNLDEAEPQGELRILSPSMARFVDRLGRISNQSRFGIITKKVYRTIKHYMKQSMT